MSVQVFPRLLPREAAPAPFLPVGTEDAAVPKSQPVSSLLMWVEGSRITRALSRSLCGATWKPQLLYKRGPFITAEVLREAL